jgi:hypothetical protein
MVLRGTGATRLESQAARFRIGGADYSRWSAKRQSATTRELKVRATGRSNRRFAHVFGVD